MKPLLLLAIHFSIGATAGGFEGIWDRKVLMDKCNQAQTEFKSWGIKSSEVIAVPPGKVDRALAMLQEIRYPTPADLEFIGTALDSKFGETLPKWLALAGADCPGLRASVGKGLIDASLQDPAVKLRIQSELKAALTAIKYPTLLNASIDAMLIDYSLKRNLWKASSSVLMEVTKQRADLKRDIDKWQIQYGSLMDEFARTGGASQPSATAEAGKNLEKIKRATFEDQMLAKKYFTRLVSLIATLN